MLTLSLGLLACGDDGGGEGPGGGLPEPLPCDACEAPRVCLRDACVAPCGASAERLDAALAEGVRPVAGYCLAGTAEAVGAGAGAAFLELVVSDPEDGNLAVRVSRRALGGVDAAADPGDVVAEATIPRAQEGAVFWSGYLGASPSGDRVAFGYTQGFGDPGRLAVAGTGDPTVLDAPGNFDAAWLDDGRLLVNGQGVGAGTGPAQGLWAVALDEDGAAAGRAVLSDAFDFSGSVAVSGGLVLYGALADDFSNRLLVVAADDVAELLDDPAGAPIDAGSDPRVVAVDGGPSAFEALPGGGLVAVRLNAEFERVFALVGTTGETPDEFALGAEVALAGPPDDDPERFDEVFVGVVPTDEPGFVLLEHGDGGLLLVDVRDL